MSAAFFASSMDASAAAEFATATAKEASSAGVASVDLAPVIKALTDKKLAAGACLAFKEFASSPALMRSPYRICPV
jgi:beta-glucosidase-like glycosyl hydrolase